MVLHWHLGCLFRRGQQASFGDSSSAICVETRVFILHSGANPAAVSFYDFVHSRQTCAIMWEILPTLDMRSTLFQ